MQALVSLAFGISASAALLVKKTRQELWQENLARSHLRRRLHKWIVSSESLQDGDATYDATQRRRRHKVVDS